MVNESSSISGKKYNWYLHRGSIIKAAVSFSSSAVSPSPDVHPLDAWFYFLHFLYCPVHTKYWFLAQNWPAFISDEGIPTILVFLVLFSCQLEGLILFWTPSLFLLPIERPLMLNNHQHFLAVFCEMTPNLHDLLEFLPKL